MRIKLLLSELLLLLLICPESVAQKHEFLKITDKADYPFMLYVPADSVMKNNPPLLLFLHGRSLSGNDLNMVKRYGPLDALERCVKIEAIIAAPQVKKGKAWEPEKILTVLNHIKKHYAFDSCRVYVIGMSLGGYGTFDFAGKYPDKVAAAVALCGGGRVADACQLSKTNLWIMHGKLDRAVPASESEKMYDAIKACKPDANCHLTLYPNLGHGELAREFCRDTVYKWLFQFRLGDSIRSNIVYETTASQQATDTNASVLLSDARKDENKPKAQNNNSPGQSKVYYTIKKGDTLYAIALRYKTTVDRLCELNGLSKNSILQIGQRILVRE